MKSKTVLALIAAGLLGGLGGWYAFSPGYAMSQLGEAAREGNADELRERIDFPRVRESLKVDLRARMAAELGDESNEGLGNLGAALGMALLDPVIESLITPESIGAMVQSGRFNRPDQQPEGDTASASSDARWTIEREGLSQFRATPAGQPAGNPPALVFEREGLGWKLVEIDLSENR